MSQVGSPDPLDGPIIRTPQPAPLQGQTEGYWGGVGAAFAGAQYGSLGASIIAKATPGGPDNALVQPADAAKQLPREQGFDPSVLPKGPVYQSAINAIRAQQQIVNNANDAARRSSSAGSVAQFVAGVAGGLTDPLFLALGPLGRGVAAVKEVAGIAKGAGVGARVATGAAEGAAVMGGYTEAERQAGTAPGDRDITSYDVLKQTGVGMVLGGAVKGAFGARPVGLDTIASLERSGEQAVSPKGAVGKYQIMPDTARQYMGKDFDVSTLHDPKVNERVAQKILDDLNEKFPGDREAQAVAYNAGPGRAREWIANGRNDATLPTETQKYLGHLRSIVSDNPVEQAANLPPEVKDAAARTAVAQASQDSEVNVDSVIKNGLAEKAAETPAPQSMEIFGHRIEHGDADLYGGGPTGEFAQIPITVGYGANDNLSALSEAAPKPGSEFLNQRLGLSMLERIDQQAAKAPPPASVQGESPELTALKSQAVQSIQEAEHAHAMAFGLPKEGEETPLHTELKAADEETKDDALIAKATDAAVRCSLLKGLD